MPNRPSGRKPVPWSYRFWVFPFLWLSKPIAICCNSRSIISIDYEAGYSQFPDLELLTQETCELFQIHILKFYNKDSPETQGKFMTIQHCLQRWDLCVMRDRLAKDPTDSISIFPTMKMGRNHYQTLQRLRIVPGVPAWPLNLTSMLSAVVHPPLRTLILSLKWFALSSVSPGDAAPTCRSKQ